MEPAAAEAKEVSQRATMVAFGLGALIVAGVCALLSAGQHAFDTRRFEESRALMVARSVAELARQGEVKDPAGVQAFLGALKLEAPAVRDAFVLKSSQYFAHTDAAKSGKRLDSKSIDDKTLFDKSRRVQKAFDQNKAALEETPELGRKVANDLEVDGGESPVVAAVPVVAGERVVGMAQASVDAAGLPASTPLVWLLGIALVATLAVALVTRIAPRLAWLAASLLTALAVIASLRVIQKHQRLEYLAMVESRAVLAAGISRALQTAGSVLNPELLAAIAVDETEKGYGDLVRVEPAPERAPEERLGALVEQYSNNPAEEIRVHDRDRGIVVSRGALRDVFHGHARTLRILGVGLALVMMAIYFFVALGAWRRLVDTVQEHAFAYAYTIPAMVGMAMLVFIPFAYGIVLGFMRRSYNVWSFVGLDNFVRIVGDFQFQPRNFYFTLVVTVMWTVINVALHVSIGLGLALLLQDKMLKMKALYRVLLVIPWAVPNYITALIWQGMFHKEFGAINHYLGYVGVEPISWFGSFWTAFAANVATNTWLGFPFMMVISLGALQSIPTDLYEAADVDGASSWQQFRAITLPLLKPALFPAIILGTIWTFNQFNIIYLVSAGQPANSTDILIVEAYRKAFENDDYGSAAAYSTIIFVILLGYTLLTNRQTKATAGAFE